MALSYFSNWVWDNLQHFASSDTNMFLNEELHHHGDEDLLHFPDVSDIGHLLFETDDLNSLLCDFSPPPPPPQFSTQKLQPFYLQQENHEPNAKRHKPFDDYNNNYHSINYYASNPNLFDGPFPIDDNSFLDPTFWFDYHLPPESNNNNTNITSIPTTLADFPNGPPVFRYGSGSNHGEMMNAKKATSVSAQSIAARNRRRKITEKMQELGKLVPGGKRMNTAEMLQSGFKYIKFLQAQVRILEFMGPYDDHHQENVELSCLLTSTLIQEKLYSAEKCLVPQTYVQELSKSHELVRSNHELLRKVKEE